MAEPDPFVAALRKTFPNADVPDHEELFTNEFIDDETRLPVADREKQEAALKAIEAHLRSAQAAYRSLHPEVRRALDAGFQGNSVARLQFAPGATLVVEGDPAQSGAHLSNVFLAALYSLTGKPDYHAPKLAARQPSALDAAREVARALAPMTGRARKAGSWSKVALVEHAIRTWQQYGKREPQIHSKAFEALLDDLTEALGRKGEAGWDATELVEAFRYSRRKRRELG